MDQFIPSPLVASILIRKEVKAVERKRLKKAEEAEAAETKRIKEVQVAEKKSEKEEEAAEKKRHKLAENSKKRRTEEEGPSSSTQGVIAFQTGEEEKKLSSGLPPHLVNTARYVCKAGGREAEVVGAGEGMVGSGEEGSCIFIE